MARWARWWPISGILFVVLWLVLFFALDEDPGDSDAEIGAFLADSSDRAYEIASLFVVLASTLFFVWFLTALRERLAQAEGRAGPLTATAFGAGLAAAVLWLIGVVLFTAVAATAEFDDEFVADPNLWRAMESAGYMTWFGGTTIASLLVFATSILILRTGFVPRWLGWLGILVGATMLVAFFFIPFLVFLGWLLLISLMLIWHPAEPEVASG